MLHFVLNHEDSNHLLEGSHHDDFTTAGENIRDWFSKTDFTHIDPYPNHTHGSDASQRSVGSNFIETVSQLACGEPFYFQGSAADARRGREVSRGWFWAKDLNMPLVDMPPPSDLTTEQVCAMVDVDEYVDMPSMLATNFRPYLLYTFVPHRAANDVGEHAFRFLSDGRVEYVVSGGGTYVHHVWDYSHDSLKVTSSEWLWLDHGLVFPLPLWHTAFYKVERRNVDADHQVVLLSPMRRWSDFVPGGLASLADKTISGPPLQRFNPIDGEFVRVEVKTHDAIIMSTARIGDFSSSCVPKRVDEEASLKATLTKDKLTTSMVKSSMENSHVEDKFGAEVMTAFHRAKNPPSSARVFTTLDGTRPYQFLPRLADHDPDANPSMRSFMRPIVHGGFCTTDTKTTDKRGVDKRVKEVRNTSRLTTAVKQAIKEFVSRIATETLVPVDEEEVYDRQRRPTQRAILERANYESRSGFSNTFIKRQAEPNVGDPRIITPIDGSDKKDYSTFMYALSDHLKKLKWFISGMKPREVAERVAAIASLRKLLAETDFSRMDGNISEVPRHLELVLMMAMFAPQVHPRMHELMRRQTMLQCTTRNGVHYNTGLSRGSGSPETSAFNTVLTGFVMFLGFYLKSRSYDEAWEDLNNGGGCNGDDGIASGLDQKCAVKAASMVGQKLTINMRCVGDTVSFLARHYGPDVWFGCTDSCCDLKRQLTKFHLAVYVENDIKARETKLREKSFAFFLTDEHTPVLGLFVKAVLALAPVQHGAGEGRTYTNLLNIWNSEIPKQDQYPSLESGVDWKLELLRQQLPDFHVDGFVEWISTCKTLEDLMNPPDPIVIEAQAPGDGEAVDVDGDILQKRQTRSPSRRGTRAGKTVKRTERGKQASPKNPKTSETAKPKTKGKRPSKQSKS